MSFVAVLERLGGSAPRAAVIRLTSRGQVERALTGGEVVVPRRGVLALSSVDEAIHRAVALRGVLSHESAAMWWGWGVAAEPKVAHVTVPKNRRTTEREHVHRVDLGPDDRGTRATSQDRTLVDCARHLSFASALAVADSAARTGVSTARLQVLAAHARGPGAPRVRRVLLAADGRAANPFESVTRAHALDAGLHVIPQRAVRHGPGFVVPDMVDEAELLVVECDSFAWHGKRHQLRRDTQRHNWLVAHGWRVVRLAYEDVMFEREYVVDLLRSMRTDVQASAGTSTQVPPMGVRSAIWGT